MVRAIGRRIAPKTRSHKHSINTSAKIVRLEIFANDETPGSDPGRLVFLEINLRYRMPRLSAPGASSS